MRTIVMEMATLRLQLLVEQIRQRADQAGEAELHALCAKLTDCKMETLKELLSGER